MEKNAIEPFKNQYVKLVKNNREILEGTIVDIVQDAVIFQTATKQYGVAIDSIIEIISHKDFAKRKKQSTEMKI